jgi:hypothetical protein
MVFFGMSEQQTGHSERRRKLEAQASSAHDLMLELMDFAAAQTIDPRAVATALANVPTCQTCGRAERGCVRGLYVRGLRPGFDDASEVDRLRGQGCHVQVVEAARLEASAPALLSALRRAIAPQG